MSMWTGSPVPSRSATSRPDRRAGPVGFTLIEVLVAFAIVAVMLTALLQVFSSSLAGIATVERRAEAMMLARSALDEVGVEIPLAAGERSADAGRGFAWRLRIAPSATLAPLADGGGLLVPYEVSVTVTWERGGSLTLTTLRLGAPAATPADAGAEDSGVDAGEASQ
jgi:general secretion pathway protein I